MSLTLWQPPSGKGSVLTPSDVERLFDKMAARYGSLFVDRFSMVPRDLMAREWADELSQYSRSELARGVEGLRGCKFPPTLPEFQALCRPPIDTEMAYHEALANLRKRERGGNPEWTHPAIYWAASEVGGHDMRTLPYHHIKARWERTLKAQLSKSEWPPIPVALLPIAAPEKVKPHPEALAKIKALADSMRVGRKKKGTKSITSNTKGNT
jgi:hypothetical protein